MSENLCEYCKINPATNHHVRQTQSGEVKSYYCLACYRKVKASDEKLGAVEPSNPTRCVKCGCSVEQFKKRKLVGCAHCYKTLGWAILPVVERMQGEEPHCGRKEDLRPRTRLMRRYNEVSVIRDYLAQGSQAERYDEELRTIQSLLFKEKE